MDEFISGIKETLGKIGKVMPSFVKRVLIPISIIAVLVIPLLGGAVYYMNVWVDGIEREDDWSSVPFATKSYINAVEVNSKGEFSSGTGVEDLWNKMKENNSRIDLYLDGPDELARLMNAQVVTQFPDIRSEKEINKPINWEEEYEKNPDYMQGIIKFNRARTDGSTKRITYADPATFQGWIEDYNRNGNQSSREKALTHFTLAKSTGGSGGSGGTGAIAAGDGVMTDVSQAIIDSANSTPSPGANLCLQWVDDVYANAGLSPVRKEGAYQSWQANGISTDRTAIPVGAAVYGTGWPINGGHNPWGHVGIYIGGGQVVDNVGSIRTVSLDEWISGQESAGNSIDGQCGWLGWGWADGNRTRGTTQDPNVKQGSGSSKKSNSGSSSSSSSSGSSSSSSNSSSSSSGSKNSGSSSSNKGGQFSSESGDGYSQIYTSSFGGTYKDFKQYEGSYSGNAYWNGTISNSGCGPTSVAILASGANYTPADTAKEMNERDGYTYSTPLKNEMDAIGMNAQIINNPSGDDIKNQLQSGKVMCASVDASTQFTSGSHIIAIVDVNSSGQVMVMNPGRGNSGEGKTGWYDVSEVTKGCNYIVVGDPVSGGAKKDLSQFTVLSQHSGKDMPTGCEITSLTAALNFKGATISKEDLADNYLTQKAYVSGESDPWSEFVGTPYGNGEDFGCYAPVIKDTANKYLSQNSISQITISDVTGASLSDLFSHIDNNDPVIVWGALKNGDGPNGDIHESTAQMKKGPWLMPEHCMVLLEYTDDTVTVADPDEGKKMTYDRAKFEKNYNALGKQAVVVGGDGIGNDSSGSDSSSYGYHAVVATWKKVEVNAPEPQDPEVVGTTTEQPMDTLSTTNVNYEELVAPYTLPYDLLWAFLVIGEDKNFIFEFADLAYDSNIEVTIYDNETINTNTYDWTYDYKTKKQSRGWVTATCSGQSSGKITVDCDGHEETDSRTYSKTIKTTTNNLKYDLTRAETWIVDYINEYKYSAPSTSTSSNTVNHDDIKWPPEREPDRTENGADCEHVDAAVAKASADARASAKEANSGNNSSNSSTTSSAVTVDRSGLFTEIWNGYNNIVENITKTTSTQKYIGNTSTNNNGGGGASGGYVVNDESLFIKDVETLKKAFSAYSTNQKLLDHAQDFLDMQNTYKVNAVFAAAVSIVETTAGTTGEAIDGCHNWFNYAPNPKQTAGPHRWAAFSNDRDGILGFGSYITESPGMYYQEGEYDSTTIYTHRYNPGDTDDANTINSLMADMYDAAGPINSSGGSSSSGESGTGKVSDLSNVLFVGDSYISGLESSGAISGAKFKGAVGKAPKYWDSRVNELPSDVDAVFTYLGTNGASESSANDMASFIDKLVDKYKDKPIYVSAIMHLGSNYKYADVDKYNSAIDIFNAKVKEKCDSTNNVHFVDTSQGLVENGYLAHPDSEGIHFGGSNDYSTWAQNIANAMAGGSSSSGSDDSAWGQSSGTITSREDKFIEIFNKWEYRDNKSRVKDAAEWLFEIIQNNSSTENMVDLIKYLLYKATGTDYGVTEFDFSIFDPNNFKNANNKTGDGSTSSDLIAFLEAMEGGGERSGEDYVVFYTSVDGCLNVGAGVVVKFADGSTRFTELIGEPYAGQIVPKATYEQMFGQVLQEVGEVIDTQLASQGVTVTSNQRDAMISFCYNCGEGYADDIVSAYKNGGDDGYGNYTKQFVHSGGQYLLGLDRRRHEEFELFTSGDYNYDPDF